MKKKNYLLIILYGITLTMLLVGFSNLYGSSTDWINQHSVIPEYFRNLFYETKRIIPNFAFNLGAGQNIFNYSYYGLFSPVILISYALPFVSMTSYVIIASIILYILSGLLMYKFLSNNYNEKTSFILSLCFMSFSSVTFHFHHHIMFVWYLPFLILSLIGVDRYVNDGRSNLLMFGILLTIMTNYYYGVSALIVVLIYGVYKLISKQDKFDFKIFINDVLKASIRIIAPVLLSAVLLVPSFYVILNSSRASTSLVSFSSLFIPNLNEVMYQSYTMGLSALLIITPIAMILSKKRKKEDVFLSLVLLIISLIPFFMYALNGFLYVRGKVLIPFSVLYIFLIGKFISSLKSNFISLKNILISAILIFLISLIGKYDWYFYILLSLDLIVIITTIKIFFKGKKELVVLVPLLITLIMSTFVNNSIESYVSKDKYKKINNKDIKELIKNIDDDSFFRLDIDYLSYINANKSYYNNHYNTTIYSSNYNDSYWRFYNFEAGNNIMYRNAFINAGTQNVLFNNLMGVKYVVSPNYKGPGYEKVKEKNGMTLYRSKNALPIIYVTDKVGNYKTYNKLKFPYNVEYMLNNPVVVDDNKEDYESSIERISLGKKENYEFELDKDTTYYIDLKTPIKNKILIISFDMNYNESCENGDTKININGVSNKLTCKSWLYHNKNKKFEYVISNFDEIDKLSVKISKGKYNISNIKSYTMDYKTIKYNGLNDLKIDKRNSMITGNAEVTKDSYVITSIPYDKGFSVFLNDKKVDTKVVNKAFLGFKINKGKSVIKIKYNAPWLNYGILLSIIGFIFIIMIIFYERKKEMIEKLILKYKELIMYFIFGVLTTIVSIGTYYFCVFTFLNAKNAIELQIANIISWILSVLFAYVTNRKFVFESKNNNILKEMASFYSARILTLLVDMTLMFVFVSLLKYNDTYVKLFVQVVVIIGNYILSKLLVFKGGK